MPRLIFIKSGRTQWDEEGRIQGNLDIPLSQSGRESVMVVQAELKPMKLRVFYTALSSAILETSKIVARPSRGKVIPTPEISEVNLGHWQGLLNEDAKHRYWKAYRQWLENPAAVCPMGGESVEDARKRLIKAVAEIAAIERDRAAAIVLPKMAWAIVMCHLRGEAMILLPDMMRSEKLWEAVEVSERMGKELN